MKVVNNKNLNNFIRKHILDFKNIYRELVHVRNSFAHGQFDRDAVLTTGLLKVFNTKVFRMLEMIEKGNAFEKQFNSTKEFDKFIDELEIVLLELAIVNKFKDSPLRKLYSSFDNHGRMDIDFIQFVFQELKSRYKIEVLMNSNNIKQELTNVTKMQEKILRDLSSKTAHYVTTDKVEINRTLDKINLRMGILNNKLQSWFWNSKLNELPLDLIEKHESFYDKINQFNDVMEKYGNIKLNYTPTTNGIYFSKEERIVPFEKLSSGERKITFLILEILFTEVDIYLIDEPELSMSLNFQNKLVVDLMRITFGKKIFIATHAPFIYDDFKKICG